MMRIITIIARLLWFILFVLAFMLTGLALLPCMAWDYAAGTESADWLVHHLSDLFGIPVGRP